jgi:predicted TIM-barrel fold metal-dependent hydrolase
VQYSFHPDSPYRSADALPETVMAMHKVMGISHGVIVNGGGYGRDPRHLMDTLKRFPAYFRGVAVPPDHLIDAEINEMTAASMRGIRFVSQVRGTHLAPILPKLAAAVAERGWHVQFYGHGGDITDNADRLLALPNDIVLDRFGAIIAEKGLDQPAFKTILKLLDTGRVWVKLSGPMRCSRLEPPYADMTPFAHALVAHAPRRLVWGTNWPHLNMNDQIMPNDGDLLDLMLEWAAISRLNLTGILDDPPAELVMPLGQSEQFSQLTAGAFDATVQTLWDLYAEHFTGANPDPNGPSQAAIRIVLRRIAHAAVEVDTR